MFRYLAQQRFGKPSKLDQIKLGNKIGNGDDKKTKQFNQKILLSIGRSLGKKLPKILTFQIFWHILTTKTFEHPKFFTLIRLPPQIFWPAKNFYPKKAPKYTLKSPINLNPTPVQFRFRCRYYIYKYSNCTLRAASQNRCCAEPELRSNGAAQHWS